MGRCEEHLGLLCRNVEEIWHYGKTLEGSSKNIYIWDITKLKVNSAKECVAFLLSSPSCRVPRNADHEILFIAFFVPWPRTDIIICMYLEGYKTRLEKNTHASASALAGVMLYCLFASYFSILTSSLRMVDWLSLLGQMLPDLMHDLKILDYVLGHKNTL